jgi:hypothetical protein
MSGCALYDTPPHAASTKTWKLGEQIWSDAIQVVECNKTSFIEGNEADCCSYTAGKNTWYYYNWPFVSLNGSWLCPDPWRVPSEQDLLILAKNTDEKTLSELWGRPGMAYNNEVYGLGMGGMIWSSSTDPIYMGYMRDTLLIERDNGEDGFQIRCVK